MRVTCFVYAVNGDGLLTTFGMRLNDATTSAAVKSLPSWNFTPLRSVNSHVVGSMVFHCVASEGSSLLLFVALHEKAVHVLRDVVVRRQVVIMRIERRDVRSESDRQVRRVRREPEDAKQRDDERVHKTHGWTPGGGTHCNKSLRRTAPGQRRREGHR